MPDFTQISYVIDADDRLVTVNPEWTTFAEQNGGVGLGPSVIAGRSIWDFIADDATRELYLAVLAKVRTGVVTDLVLRCDAPSRRRLVEMVVTSLGAGRVEFRTVLLSVKDRPEQRLFSTDTPRTTQRLMVCSWCDRVHVGEGEWLEVEEAMEALELTEQTELPQLDPTVCMDCFTVVMETVSRSIAEVEPI